MVELQSTADALLHELKLGHLQGKKRKAILDSIVDHFNKVIIVTLLSALSEEKFERFQKALKSTDFEGEIEKISAEVPGIGSIVESRIEQEYKLMKAFVN